jgi:uncharacterized membrane protein YfcA
LDSTFYLAAIAATLLAGLSKGGFGGGLGGLSVPILSLTIAPSQAVAIMAPILITMDLMGYFIYRRQIDRRILRIILPGGLAGTLIGWALFSHLNDHWIRVMLGVIALVFVAWNLSKSKPAAEHPSRIKGWFWAGMSGLTSFVAHAGSPPLSVYLLGLKIDKEAYVGTVAMFFMTINLLKVVPYWELGLFTPEVLRVALWMVPVALGGIWIGVTLQRRVSPTRFFQIANLMLLISGTKLLYDGIRGVLG